MNPATIKMLLALGIDLSTTLIEFADKHKSASLKSQNPTLKDIEETDKLIEDSVDRAIKALERVKGANNHNS